MPEQPEILLEDALFLVISIQPRHVEAITRHITAHQHDAEFRYMQIVTLPTAEPYLGFMLGYAASHDPHLWTTKTIRLDRMYDHAAQLGRAIRKLPWHMRFRYSLQQAVLLKFTRIEPAATDAVPREA